MPPPPTAPSLLRPSRRPPGAPRAAGVEGTQLLGGRDGDTALVVAGRHVSYGALRGLVAERRAELGATRRLVLLEASTSLGTVVTHLAALSGGHPVLLVEAGPEGSPAARHRRGLVERFDPDVVATAGPDGGGALHVRREGSRHELHPDLAVLLSTSGSTGSPKLVRLSSRNVLSNAAAIGEYLGLDATDRAATTMPLHYCYGLSVLHSHLLAGASVLLSDRSVVEDAFWAEFTQAGATSFAAVPYTFDLLDSSGFAERSVPGLRCITQAGGRLAPDRVREYARLGRRRGFDLVVMYGQTEATARMAYVPPHLAEQAAGAIGVPVPGGRLRVDADPGRSEGELVFSGPGVMMGYAESPADLAAGASLRELRTGDRARQREDGMFEVLGRVDRYAKVFGLRVDLDRVEALLGSDRVPVRAVALEDRLALFVTAARHGAAVRTRAVELLGLPAHAVQVHAVAEFPRTSTGKPDHACLVRHAHELARPAGCGASDAARGSGPQAVVALYRELLGRPDAGPDDSFAGLDGDSLSYVEVSLRLEELLGAVPRHWPAMSARELAALLPPEPPAAPRGAPGPPGPAESRLAAPAAADTSTRRAPAPTRSAARRWSRVETPTLLRAVAIVLVVGTHADAFTVQGGAHLLLAVVGYNLARFRLVDLPGRSRSGPLLRSAAHVLIPAALWIGAVWVATGYYRPTTALLLTNVVAYGEPWSVQWQFWFLEVVVWSTLALAAVLAVPAVDRLERRRPYGFALGVLALALLLRLTLTGGVQADAMERYAVPVVLWCVALGWLVARSTTWRRRLGVTALTLLAVPGFLGEPQRELVVVVGVLLLVWVSAVPVPRALVPLVGVLAGASLFVYLTHWQVYPGFEATAPWLGLLLSLVVGVLAWRAWTAVTGSRARTAVDALAVAVRGDLRTR